MTDDETTTEDEAAIAEGLVQLELIGQIDAIHQRGQVFALQACTTLATSVLPASIQRRMLPPWDWADRQVAALLASVADL